VRARTADLYRVKVARLGSTTTYKTAGTAKVRGSRTRHHTLWVGLWVGKKPNYDQTGAPSPLTAIALTELIRVPTLTVMEVHIKPETQSRLTELASKSGRATDDLVEDALAGYLAEVTEVREMLDGRYDDIKSGRVKPIDGEAFFDSLRQREDELLKQRNPK
jgi:predicted transcriptional regulator